MTEGDSNQLSMAGQKDVIVVKLLIHHIKDKRLMDALLKLSCPEHTSFADNVHTITIKVYAMLKKSSQTVHEKLTKLKS